MTPGGCNTRKQQHAMTQEMHTRTGILGVGTHRLVLIECYELCQIKSSPHKIGNPKASFSRTTPILAAHRSSSGHGVSLSRDVVEV